jgi:B9 domain-containing protein 1
MGRDVPVGYGNVHVPTTPGRHVRYVRTFVPESSSLLVRFIGWLKGRPAEYSDPARTLGSGQGREVTRVTSHGLVKVVFVIAQVNMDKFGF